MERLTFDGNFCDIAKCREINGGSSCKDGYCSQRKVWERLKQYEDAEAEGRLVMLPCSAEDMKMCIEELDLSVRAYHCLKIAGINTVGQLIKLSDEQIANIRNIGKQSFEEIKAKIADFKAKANYDRKEAEQALKGECK